MREHRHTREEEVEEESPARSILGLGRIEPSPLRLDASARRRTNGGPPPNSSLLGLQGLDLPPLRIGRLPAEAEGAPPTESLLGLQGLRAAPLARVPLPPGTDTEPPNGSLLGLGDYRPTTPLFRPPAPKRAPAVEAESRSFFGLPVRAAAAPRAEAVSRSFFGLPAPPPGAGLTPEEVAEIVPEFEKDVEHRAVPAFPVERAVLASVFAHVLLLILLLRMPAAQSDPSKGLLAAFVPPPKSEEEKFPIVFREAPGPARENPKKSADLSDADRRAGGGDPSKKRSDTPFIPDRNGMRGLRPGPPVARAAPPRPASPPAEAARPKPETQAMAQAPQTTLDKDPNGFQVPRNGPTRDGSASQQPRALADIASVAKDAARQVVSQAGGGENGAGFPNPDGGLVDTGPVSFETKWYDWGEYMEAMLRRIKLHHDILRDPFKGWVTYRWAILPDGRVADLQRVDTSGNPAYDAMARRAIEGSNPFKPLPKDLLLTLGAQHREHVTVTFIYNYSTAEFESLVRNRR